MKHDISPELAAAFTKRAAALGFEIRTAFANSDKKLCLIAYQGQTEVCQFELYGGMRYFPGNPLVVERKQLNALLLDMKQAHDLYADARPFVLRGIHKEDGYRLISEFDDTVLAARMGKDNEVRFTTWQYDYDRMGVHRGNYYETNYEGAKLDFAVRAGLIDKKQLFTKDELVALHDACVFRGRNDDEISYEDGRKLQAVMEKVEDNIPDLIFVREQPEQEDGLGIQPD